MAGSVNKAIIVGNLGGDPETRSFQNGGKVCNFSVATSESWKDKATGERKERTQWHRIVIFNEALADIAQKYLKKGDKVYIEAAIETRKYEKDGKDVYTTEIVLRPYNGNLTILSNSKKTDTVDSQGGGSETHSAQTKRDDMDQDIPF